jgi:hypothetical protein
MTHWQVSACKLTLLEVLSSFRSVLATMDLVALTGLLPRLAPRYYSISSSPAAGARRWVRLSSMMFFLIGRGRHQAVGGLVIASAQLSDMLGGWVMLLLLLL